tara:strand:+ start:387 stop:578 length:192 start_codon:yes stop_codon:yes gene_type:complete
MIFFLSKKLGKRIVAINYLAIFIISLILLLIFSTNENNTMKKYISPSYDGEKILPGYFDNENS